ncbi:hypothetical protein NYY93_21220, partial [Acinetobacter baumannii]|nr:hypothetical protein [Acinetobacter baumannii]
EREFYSPVRLRGGHHASDLEDHGISYIELRNIDLNPFETYGFSYEQAEFLHLFLIYLLWKDEGENCDEWVKMGDFYTDIVALEHPLEHTQFEIEAKNMINEMEQLAETLNLTISETLFVQLREMLMDPSKTLAGRLYKESVKSSQGQVATSIA